MMTQRVMFPHLLPCKETAVGAGGRGDGRLRNKADIQNVFACISATCAVSAQEDTQAQAQQLQSWSTSQPAFSLSALHDRYSDLISALKWI